MKNNLLFPLLCAMLTLFTIGSTAQTGITKFGTNALLNNTTGDYNSAFGQNSLYSNTSGYNNTATGYSALYFNSIGNYNTADGFKSLFSNTTGSSNTANGRYSLYSNTTASYNTATGYSALYSTKTGSNNTAIGYKAGDSINNGSNNVFVGYKAGTGVVGGSNNIYIGSSTKGSANVTNTVAIGYGVKATQNNTIILGTNQNVGIGTSTPTYRLDVCGSIRAKEILVQTGWCDYVFDKNYKLTALEEVENFISQNQHLPNIPKASEVEKNGLKVAEISAKMMEKIEELTLYVIDMNKRIKILENENAGLKKQILNQTIKETP